MFLQRSHTFSTPYIYKTAFGTFTSDKFGALSTLPLAKSALIFNYNRSAINNLQLRIKACEETVSLDEENCFRTKKPHRQAPCA